MIPRFKPVRKGQVVYLSVNERTDPFKHHQYSTVQYGRTVIIRAVVVGLVGNEFRARLEGNGDFLHEGQTYVFNRGSLLEDQHARPPHELGQWKQWDTTSKQ